MSKAIYRGFSTADWFKNRSFSTNNVETVKRDLLNHIYTVRGERVMMPNFGTRIPIMAFEPLDTASLDIIRKDLTTVFEYDPRVQIITLDVFAQPDQNTIVALADLLYIEFNVRDTLRIEVASQ